MSDQARARGFGLQDISGEETQQTRPRTETPYQDADFALRDGVGFLMRLSGGTYMARTSARLWRGEAAFVAACSASVCSAVTARRMARIVARTPPVSAGMSAARAMREPSWPPGFGANSRLLSDESKTDEKDDKQRIQASAYGGDDHRRSYCDKKYSRQSMHGAAAIAYSAVILALRERSTAAFATLCVRNIHVA